MPNSESLSLQFGLSFDDLYRREGLVRIDAAFVDHLKAVDAGLCARLMDARVQFPSRKTQSELMVELAPHVDDFIGELFGISTEALEARHEALGPVYALKRKFIQKKAISGVTAEKASAINGRAAAMELEALFNEPLTEGEFCRSRFAVAGGRGESRGGVGRRRAVWRLGRAFSRGAREAQRRGVVQGAAQAGADRHREGFKLTDAGMI
jgi:hypothetical protein